MLRIRNFAIVEDLEVEFFPGLNVLTGATGAGKSIIIGALNLALGERASSEMIRTGADCAIVEAVFAIKPKNLIEKNLSELGILYPENQLIVHREISSKGVSRCFLNDRLVTLANLKIIGDLLADLHGQHEHQSLLDSREHLTYLDNYSEVGDLLARVGNDYSKLKKKLEELEELKRMNKVSKEKKELYQFQLNEITRAGLSVDEEEKLSTEKKILENSEALFQIASMVFQELYDIDGSIIERLSLTKKELEKGGEYDPRLKDHIENLNSAILQLNDSSRFLQGYKDSLNFDPEKLEKIRERLNLINSLKKKYGQSIEEVLSYADKIKVDLEKIENRDELIQETEQEIKDLRQILKKDSMLLSDKRKEKGSELSRKIKKELSFLGMERCDFEVKISWCEEENGLLEINSKRYYVDEKGMDQVEFYVSPNPGEELKPLAKIASGGEISRIMLALKSVLAKSDQIPTMIFDEVDVGIGGEIAEAVGKRMKTLSSTHQIICITHLQQIASQADYHFKVYKEVSKNRTITKIKLLSREERIKEIARMIGGKKISDLSLEHAAEMIEE
ncbi:MAG: DNA repair protein RecN [candidate division Zixibacteria bacterium RBG_16_43_9]|nr:MAG: DNA repair protein RecN [candidate division Zixibacteria bacterium RBG_16_43_9]